MPQYDRSASHPHPLGRRTAAPSRSACLPSATRRLTVTRSTYYYRGLDHNEYERIAAGFALGCSLLTSRGVPCSGEGNLKNCQAMKIVDTFGAGGSYSEVTAMDFRENFILAGHDGPFHLAISSERPLLRGLELFHGKRGGGVGVETQVRHGPVTLLSMTQTRAGDLKLVAAQGDSIPGPVLQIGNTDSRLQFSLGPAEFIDAWCREGPTHHFALGVGHILPRIEKFASMAALELRVVAASRTMNLCRAVTTAGSIPTE